MQIALSWLADYVDLSGIATEKLAAELTEKVAEVEHIVSFAANQPAIVVGEIREVRAHPNADKLRICRVAVGAEEVQIVCGGTNVRDGLKVAVALPGARVRWHGEGEPVVLAKAKLRGEESVGMICSATELEVAPELLGTEPPDHGIVELATEAPAGTPLAEAFPALKEVVFEIDNHAITHRPDLFGQVGFAREVAAILRRPFTPPAPAPLTFDGGVAVKIEIPEKCARYIGVRIENVRVQPSPPAIAARLAACGVRAINNIVDATNYVMLELGQPMHAFDAKKLQMQNAKCEIIVRNAVADEKLQTLDGVERKLNTEMLVIADADPSTGSGRAVAVAGVIGGGNSEVDEKTTELLLEAASFDAVAVRRTSGKLAVRTEASLRFEKRLDPALSATAAARFVEILRQTCPDLCITAATDALPAPLPELPTVELSRALLQSRIGVTVEDTEVVAILTALGFAVENVESGWRVTVPSFRAGRDVGMPLDLVEEVARHHGFNSLPNTFPALPLAPVAVDPARALAAEIADQLVGFGFHETCTLALTDAKTLAKTGHTAEKCASLVNPPSADHKYLRPCLLSTLLTAAATNARSESVFRLFEISTIFKMMDAEVTEKDEAVAVIVGEADVFAASRGVAESLLASLKFTAEWRSSAESPRAHPGRSTEIWVAGQKVGRVAELHPAVAVEFDLPRTGYFYLDLPALAAVARPAVVARGVPRFPAVPRDIAVLVPQRTLARDLEQAIRAADSLVASVTLFDTYTGSGVPAGQKSLAFRLTLQDETKTLTDAETEAALAKIVTALEKVGAQLRA